MMTRIGDMVRINCVHSKYNAVIGEVFEIRESIGYAMIDMPIGTEMRAERIRENAIMRQMLQSEKTRKTPVRRLPKGEPQWFPLSWLTLVQPTQATLNLDMKEATP
jgi:hypothetical protein